MQSRDKIPQIPRHVGIIMDGNGRWAQRRGLPRIEGHRQGAKRAKEVIRLAKDMGMEALTLYAFSKENWQRPDEEVGFLMKLLELYLRSELEEILGEGIRFRTIGEIWRLPENIQNLIAEMEEKSARNNRMTLVAALSYGGRDEILRAARKAIASGMPPEKITEETFSELMDTAGLPAPDLIIRTSGERRLSNFLLWQAAYSELYFTEANWPEFGEEEFMKAIEDYQGRERRFGAISAQGA